MRRFFTSLSLHSIFICTMKSILIALFTLVTAFQISAQTKEIDVYEKKEGDKIIVMARNTSKSDYTVTVKINSEGMTVVPSSMVEAVVPAGKMKEMATLTPNPGEGWSYGFEVSYKQSTTKQTQPNTVATTPGVKKELAAEANPNREPVAALSDAAIVLYSKPGCSRCAFAKKQLDAKGIAYLEVDTQSDSPEVANMWTQLRSNGFKGGSVTMPVIRENGRYHYDIQDLQGFISKLKKG